VVVDSPWGVGEAVLGPSIPDRRMPLRTPPGYARNPWSNRLTTSAPSSTSSSSEGASSSCS
jgi:hypothetical protein